MSEQPIPPEPVAEAEEGTFRCLICLDDRPFEERSRALRCSHLVCASCTQDLWTHTIMSESDGFPRCPMPGCDAYASDAVIAASLAPQAVRRMRQLRGLKPARSADGHRMWCVTPGCHEPLAPPLLVAAPEDGNEEAEKVMISTCPACGQGACMRCGSVAHEGTCAAPLPCGRQRRLYNAYAVGRIMACPRCGVHIERSGGCRTVSCARCAWSFTFLPFRTPQEVEEANIVQDLSAPGPMPVTWANSCMIWVFLFPMFIGAFVSYIVFGALLATIMESDWAFLFFVPPLFMGLIFFVTGFFGVLLVCRNLLPRVGEHVQGSMCNVVCTLMLSIAMLALQFGSNSLPASTGFTEKTWQWLIFFLPVVVCNLTLFVMTVTHMIIVGVRALIEWRQRRGFDQGEDDGGEGMENEMSVP